MDGSGGGESSDLIQSLFDHPQQFEFFQAVRLLQVAVAQDTSHPYPSTVGSDPGPHTESIRFKALPSLSFPAGDIASLNPSGSTSKKEVAAHHCPAQMMVSFMGLTGPGGVLPQHYTTLLIERAHTKHKDASLREFLDLFNHRAISLFYRAWEKYRLPLVYEQQLQKGDREDDLFTRCLFSLVGLQTEGLRHRFPFDDQAIVSFGGHFAGRCRNVTGLKQLLSEYFDIEIEVDQFVGQWLMLPEDSQTSLPDARHPAGLNTALGSEAVIGSRVWDVQSRIRIVLGPLIQSEFQQFVPGQDQLRTLQEMVRFYIGTEIDFDVQLILRKEDVPPCRLTQTDAFQPQLGWNTWLHSEKRLEHASDAVFHF